MVKKLASPVVQEVSGDCSVHNCFSPIVQDSFYENGQETNLHCESGHVTNCSLGERDLTHGLKSTKEFVSETELVLEAHSSSLSHDLSRNIKSPTVVFGSSVKSDAENVILIPQGMVNSKFSCIRSRRGPHKKEQKKCVKNWKFKFKKKGSSR